MLNDNFTEQINSFWFGEVGENGLCSPEKSARWFKKDSNFDRLVEQKFSDLLVLVRSKKEERSEDADRILQDPRTALAFVILTDQFPRNIYRAHPQSFAFDGIALATSQKGMRLELDSALLPIERLFFYMPLMHSEDILVQEVSVKTFSFLAKEAAHKKELAELLKYSVDYAQQHFDIIKQFGRFPHRNEIVGRQSTAEEIEFLKQPGSSF